MTTGVVVLVRPTLFAAIGTSFLRRSLHHNLSLVSTPHHRHHRNNNTSFHSYSSSNGGSSSISIISIIKLRSRRRMRNLCTRATQANDSASSIHLIHSMEKKIKEQLNAQVVVVKDAYGDGRHVSIDVVSSAFEGASAVNRQRMVYKAIWEELQTTVHAVDQMTTRTPAEAAVNR